MAYNANNRINNNPYVLNKNEGSNSTKNLYQNVAHKNDLQSMGIQIGNSSAVMSKKQDLSNLKQQINMVSNFAKNLQFQSKLKKPTSLINRNEREYAKNSLAPSPSQFVRCVCISI